MKLSDVLKSWVDAYVDLHETEIYDMLFERLDVDLDDIMDTIIEAQGETLAEMVEEEILNRIF